MRVAVASVASLGLAATALLAQTANYAGYAYADCTPGRTPATRLILLQGPVPGGVPASAPRPSIDLLVYGALDEVAGKPLTVSPEPEGDATALARSCPVVGSCGAARAGTLTLTRGADGAITGAFRAQWGNALPREGTFSVEWRDNPAACG